MSVIEVSGLTRDFGGKGVFELSFSVGRGEVFGFLGPNGAGKTTTIRHLMGFLRPRHGKCTVDGLDCWHDRAKIQQRLGYIPGEISFMDDMTGAQFVDFICRYRGMRGRGRADEMLSRFELDPRGKIRKMSKGMKQKLGIAAAFLHDPEVLILDEPTSGLDPLMQSRFIELIVEERARGKTVLMSSHMFEEVERTCHRVSIIKDGRLVAIDSVDALKAAQVKKYIITLESDSAAQAFSQEWPLSSSIDENRVTVTLTHEISELTALMARYPVTNISAPAQSLEEIFMRYYGGDDNA